VQGLEFKLQNHQKKKKKKKEMQQRFSEPENDFYSALQED
jgi:hypothetical protein